MTKEDIIRMAREADFGDGIVEFIGVPKFERFAALVAAAKDEEHKEQHDWRSEYQKAVELHCITLDELREADAWIKNLEKLMANQDVMLKRQTAREFVGLSDEEAVEVMRQVPHLTIGGLLSVEAKLKERTMDEQPTYKFHLTQQQDPEWKCYLFGNKPETGHYGIVYTPSVGNVPNWFIRWMMKVCLGCTWVREKNT